MLAKRVIPCLDVDGGRVVKGTKFQDLRDAGDPVELAARYDREGADELVFLDITATVEGRAATLDVIAQTAEQVFIPLTVGGGVQDRGRRQRAAARRRRQGRAEQRRRARSRAAAAVRRPVRHAVHGGGDRRQAPRGRGRGGWEVFVDAGRTGTGRDAVEWAVEATTERGAGEVLLTSMDRDGTGDGLRPRAASRGRGRRAGARHRQRRRRRTRRTSRTRSPGRGRRGARRQPRCTSASSRSARSRSARAPTAVPVRR